MAELGTTNGISSARVHVGEEDGTPVIRLVGEIDMMSAERIRPALDTALHCGAGRVVFDLADVSFMDSSGLALLVIAAKRVKVVELRHPSDPVRRVLELTGLAEILHVAPLAAIFPG